MNQSINKSERGKKHEIASNSHARKIERKWLIFTKVVIRMCVVEARSESTISGNLHQPILIQGEEGLVEYSHKWCAGIKKKKKR